jgi:hypothetical protein
VVGVLALLKDQSKGLLGSRVLPGLRGITLIQYWRSFEQLERFARGQDDPHLPAWRRFNQLVGTGGDVGIWHETYRVEAGAYESIYNNMPRFDWPPPQTTCRCHAKASRPPTDLVSQVSIIPKSRSR